MAKDQHEQLAEKTTLHLQVREEYDYKPLVDSQDTLCNTLAAVNGRFNSCTSRRNETGDIYSLEVTVNLII